MALVANWKLASAAGAIYFWIALHPECTTREISEGLIVTQRTVWGHIGPLIHAGLITFRREGKGHRYHTRLPWPTEIAEMMLREYE